MDVGNAERTRREERSQEQAVDEDGKAEFEDAVFFGDYFGPGDDFGFGG